MSERPAPVGLRKTAIPLVAIGLGMAGFAGTTQVAAEGSDRVLDRLITVRLDPSTVGYFAEIDSFRFTDQVLQPGERGTMPVTAYVDPERVDGTETAGVTTITLSYTFYETELDRQVELDQTKIDAGND